MPLVDYSDSEESGSELPPQQPQLEPPKPAFQKVVDRSDTHKIKVSLPKLDDAAEEDRNAVEPPAKRARTASTFDGFGSLLPAPKNSSASTVKTARVASAGGSILAQSRGGRPAGRINLKTGATPAFSRQRQEEPEDYDEYGEPVTQLEPQVVTPTSTAPIKISAEDATTQTSKEEAKLGAKPLMFKPLSVTPKSNKKKPPATATTKIALNGSTGLDTVSGTSKAQAPTPTRPKTSLFSTDVEDTTQGKSQSAAEYDALLGDEDAADEGDQGNYDQDTISTSQTQQPPQTAPTNDLGALTNTLGLSASERRQLFGRGGQPSNAQIAQFNLAEEYKHNQELRENEESTPAHNPVKSIAPGKHSLQQLVSAAQTNKGALDESFARGKSNKRAAGSKYGW